MVNVLKFPKTVANILQSFSERLKNLDSLSALKTPKTNFAPVKIKLSVNYLINLN